MREYDSNNAVSSGSSRPIQNKSSSSSSKMFMKKNFNALCTCTNSTSPDGGNVTITIQKRSFKYFVFLFCITLSTLNIIPLLRFQLPKEFFMQESTKIYGPDGWSNIKLLVYMTTHFSDEHIAFLPCWKDAIQRMDIFQYADLMLYNTGMEPTQDILDMLPFRNIIMKQVVNPGYQEGALQALLDPFTSIPSWFDQYDWVMRLNPDVLIRHDTWLIETMLNPNIDLIIHECTTPNDPLYPLYHTDFFIFRPHAIDPNAVHTVNRTYKGFIHAESHFTNLVKPIVESGRSIFVKGALNEQEGMCRIAGLHSPVIHIHEILHYCPNYYNITNGIFF